MSWYKGNSMKKVFSSPETELTAFVTSRQRSKPFFLREPFSCSFSLRQIFFAAIYLPTKNKTQPALKKARHFWANLNNFTKIALGLFSAGSDVYLNIFFRESLNSELSSGKCCSKNSKQF